MHLFRCSRQDSVLNKPIPHGRGSASAVTYRAATARERSIRVQSRDRQGAVVSRLQTVRERSKA
jgi:hypothetical protein